MSVPQTDCSRKERVKPRDARSVDITLTFEEIQSGFPGDVVSWNPLTVGSNYSPDPENFSGVSAGYFVFFLRTQLERANGVRSEVKLNGKNSPMEKCFDQFQKDAKFLRNIFGCKEGQLTEYLRRSAGEVWLSSDVELNVEILGGDGKMKDRSGDTDFLLQLEECLSSMVMEVQFEMDILVDGVRDIMPVSMKKYGSKRGLFWSDYARLEFSSNEPLELAVFWVEHNVVCEALPETAEELTRKPYLRHYLDYDEGTIFKLPATGGIAVTLDEKPHLAFVYAKQRTNCFTETERANLKLSLDESIRLLSAELAAAKTRETAFFDLLKLKKLTQEGKALVKPWQEALLEGMPANLLFAQVAVLEPSEAELNQVYLAS